MTNRISQMNAGIEGTREEIGRLNDNVEEVKSGAKKVKDRVIRHFRENRRTYIGIVASGLVCGAAGAGMRGGRGNGSTDVQAINKIGDGVVLAWKSIFTQTNNVYYGDPGNHVMCVETGEGWNSQGAAARAKGIHPSYLSNHLRGVTPHCKNLHFVYTDDHGLEIVKPEV